MRCVFSKLLLFLEEHCEADDCAVDEQTAHYGHDHCGDLDKGAVGQDDG